MKLDDEVEKLSKQREQTKANEVFYVVSYYYVLLGKKILKEQGTGFRLNDNQRVSPEARSDIKSSSCKFPGRSYESFKVCYNCFKVYSLLMKLWNKKTKELKKAPLVRPARNYYESEIGFINKDNLNDLLVDIRFYKKLRKGQCDDNIKSQYASMTEYSLNQCLGNTETKELASSSQIKDKVPRSQSNNVFKIRTKKRVLSKVAQYYIGKTYKSNSRIAFK